MRKLPPGILSVAAMLVVGLVFAGIGGYYLVVQENGTAARATVTACKDTTHYLPNGQARTETICKGYWVLGGPLGDGGRKVFGEVRNAGWNDLNDTVNVRIYRGRAYTTGFLLPIALLAFGGVFALLGVGMFLLLPRLARTFGWTTRQTTALPPAD